jgi:hypothetical protein
MFNGFDGVCAVADGGASGAFGDVLDECGDADGAGEVGSDEDDAVSDRSGLEGEGGLGAREETAARDAGFGGDGFLGCDEGQGMLRRMKSGEEGYYAGREGWNP